MKDSTIIDTLEERTGRGRRIRRSESHGSDDRMLFARFLEGDDEAFMEFFDRHTSRIGSYCRKMLGDAEGADDILQDVWEKVILMREDSDPMPPNPLGLLYWMARNLCLNRLRNRKHHAPLHDLPEAIHPVVEEREMSSLGELVVIALGRLPFSQREPLILNAYSGYTFEEIAEMMNEPVGAIRTRAWRARRQLKRVIAALIELDENNEREEQQQ